MSVASIDNETGGDLPDDGYSGFSDYKHPESRYDGHTKPDTAAVGSQIEFPNGNQSRGTSLSAPMVTGVVTLMRKLADDDSTYHNVD